MFVSIFKICILDASASEVLNCSAAPRCTQIMAIGEQQPLGPQKSPARSTGTSQIVSELGTIRSQMDVSEEMD